jgi:hypothetical protein
VADLELQRITDLDIWRRLLGRSPQATRFLDPEFLNLFGVVVRYYGLFRSGVCIMGVPVIDTPSALPWCYKQGPIFFDEIYRSAPAKRIQYEVELAETALTQLAKIEPTFRFALHESLTDMRGYDWVHYNEPDKSRCKITPRYTAVLPIRGLSSDEIRKQARSARRQEEGYAQNRENLSVFDTGTIEELNALYIQTFARQGSEISTRDKRLFTPYITHFLNAGIGHILTVRDECGSPVAAAFLFQDYDNVWHVPIIGTAETRYGGTLLYFRIADFVHEQGGVAIDFDGANSPNRAYFKHSLGAHPVLYFDVSYEAKNG